MATQSYTHHRYWGSQERFGLEVKQEDFDRLGKFSSGDNLFASSKRHLSEEVLTHTSTSQESKNDNTDQKQKQAVNFFFALLQERSRMQKGGGAKVCVLTSYFLTKYMNVWKGYKDVAGWADKQWGEIDLFTQDLLLLPYHSPGHWSLVAMWMQKKRSIWHAHMPAQRGHDQPQRLQVCLL